MPYQTIKRCGVVTIDIESGSHDAKMDPQLAHQLVPKSVAAKDVDGALSLTCLIERRDNHMILKPDPPSHKGGKLWGKPSVDRTIQILKEVCYIPNHFFKHKRCNIILCILNFLPCWHSSITSVHM